MAVTRGTLQLARRLRRDIGTEVDGVDRALTTAWVKEWDGLASAWHHAAADLVAEAGRLGHWPRPTDIARLPRVMAALDRSEQALVDLSDRTGELATAAAHTVINADVELEPRIIASQAPATEQEGLLAHVSGRFPVAEQDREQIQLLALSRIRTDAVDVIRNRAAGQVTSDLLPLSDEASEAMRRELIRGVDVGANPREAASRMVNAVEGRFNGGLTRALTISRTETLDAYRATSQQIHSANADVVPAWSWLAELDHRTCPSCWAMDGQQFPSAVPGPDDHPQGRCARIPVLASWAELGITAPEPPSVRVDAEERFWSLPEADRLRTMGPGRLRLLSDGSIGFRDLSTLRNNPGWRPSRVPTPLRDLQRRAATRPVAPGGPAATPRLTPTTRPPRSRTAAPPARTPTSPAQPASRFHRDLDSIEDLAATVERGTIVQRRALTGGAQAETELVTFADGTRLVHKAGGSPDAEQLASALGRSLGVQTPRVYRNEAGAVWMDYVDDGITAVERHSLPEAWEVRRRLALGFPEDADRIGLLDVLIGNVDRNPGNWMLTSGGRTVAIDHGFGWEPVQLIATMPPGSVVNRVIINGPFAESYRSPNPLTAADVVEVRRRLEVLRPQFTHLGRGDWLDFSLSVLDDIAGRASGSRNLLA